MYANSCSHCVRENWIIFFWKIEKLNIFPLKFNTVMNRFLYLLPLVSFALASCSKEVETPAPPPTPTYKLSFSAEEGGTVSTEGGTYTQGSKITVTATADGQYLFEKWSDGSTINPREITVTSNLTLYATFVKKTYPLSVTVEGEGTVQEEVIIQGYSHRQSIKLELLLG